MLKLFSGSLAIFNDVCSMSQYSRLLAVGLIMTLNIGHINQSTYTLPASSDKRKRRLCGALIIHPVSKDNGLILTFWISQCSATSHFRWSGHIIHNHNIVKYLLRDMRNTLSGDAAVSAWTQSYVSTPQSYYLLPYMLEKPGHLWPSSGTCWMYSIGDVWEIFWSSRGKITSATKTC